MKTKRTFSLKMLLLLFAALFLLFPILLIFCGFFLAPQYEDTFLGEMKYKLERLQTTEGKRIVLIGGSNVPFSIKSELIAESFPDYKVVDFGLYADMGTVVMLDWAKVNVSEGDIYILMPEQNEQTLSNYFSGEDVWQAADGDFNLLLPLSNARYEKLLASFPVFAGKKLFYHLNGVPDANDVYARSSFNEYGDIAYPNREYNIMSEAYNPNDTISFSDSVISHDFIAEANNFAAYVKERGASIYYHFPPMNQLALESNTKKSTIDAYYDNLAEQLSFPILGNPHNCILESGWFYDTNFHLNNSGAVFFTNMIIEDLKIIFQDTSATETDAVVMPSIPSLKFADGDSSYADCFTYEATQTGWYITGLSPQGQSSATLIVPVSYDKKPVTGFSETLFINNTTLCELTIQSNIGTLYDGMFRGCTALKKLILTGNPSDYSIGSELMKEADFSIYVPEETLDLYKRHYSWQQYSSFLFSD